MKLRQAPLWFGVLVLALVLAACGGSSPASPAESPAQDTPQPQSGQQSEQPAQAGGNTLQVVKNRGQLVCGVNNQLPGFGSVDSDGNFIGFDVDFCKAIAAAIFGDGNKVEYRPLSAQERFTALQTKEVDVLIRNTTWTTTRDTSVGLDFAPTTFFDGQGMMVRKESGVTTLKDMAGASICVQSGTTTELNLADVFRAQEIEFTPVVFETHDAAVSAYDEGRCDGFTTDKSGLVSTFTKVQEPDTHKILDETMSKEPLGPAVLQGDPQWADVVNWVVFGLFSAEEYGVTAENVDSFQDTQNPNIRRMLGIEGELGKELGLDNDFMVNAIKAVGNYGEIYERNLGPDTPFDLPRGLNALYTEGGLIYAPPFR